MSREEILSMVPDNWGNVRYFTEEERLSLFDGKVIFSDETVKLKNGQFYRVYFVLARDTDTDAYTILKKVDAPGVVQLGVPVMAQMMRKQKK